MAVACAQVIAAGRTFAADGYQGRVVPALAYLGRRVRGLEVPEWWDGVGLGVPFAANPDHPAFYPPAWLMAALPNVAGADLLMVAHLLWLGVGVALLARRLGAGDAYLMVAGGAAVVSGASAAAIADGSLMALAWTPWVLVAAARAAAAGDTAEAVRAGFWLALALALQACAGPLGYAPMTAALAVAIAAAHGARATVAVVLAVVAGAVASALVWVPAAQLALEVSSLSAPAGWSSIAGVLAPVDRGLYVGAPLVLLAGCALTRRGLWPVALVTAAGVVLGCARARGHLSPALLVVIALAPVGLTRLSTWWGERPRLAGVGVPLVAAALVGHMIPLWWSAAPLTDRATASRAPFLVADAMTPEARRLARPPLSVADRDADPAMAHRTARANRATRFGFDYAVGVDRALSPRLLAAWRAASLRAERFLDLYSVDLVALPRTVAQAMSAPVAAVDPRAEIALVENDVARPRGFVAARWRWYADDAAVTAELFPAAAEDAPAIELSTARLIGAGTDGGADTRAPARACVVSRPRAERVELACPTDADGYAVLTDAWDPAWSATVDRQPRTIERADLAVRAVAKARGEQHVVFSYRAPGLRLGALVSALALLNLACLAWLFRRRRPRAAAE